MSISETGAKEIAGKLAAVRTRAARTKIIRNYTGIYGCHPDTIYRAARAAGWSLPRKARADRGKRRIPEETMAQVAAIIRQSSTKRKSVMPAYKAIELAEERELIPGGMEITVSYLNRWMRENECSKRQPQISKPHIELRSLYPNHVHQFDTTRCLQWYLKPSGKIGYQDPVTEVYRNKSGKGPPLFRYMIVDHATGQFYVTYFFSEDSKDHIEFLWEAWMRDRDLVRYPFRGVPQILVGDNGAALRSEAAQTLLRNLGVEWTPHLPENPRAKGTVERTHWLWEQDFESELRLRPVVRLKEIRERAYERCIKLNATKIHTRHKMTRSAAFSLIKEEELRLVPSRKVFFSLAYREKPAKMGENLKISYKTKKYLVPDPELMGKWVEVKEWPFEENMIQVRYEDKRYLVSPEGTDRFGFSEHAVTYGDYKSWPKTSRERLMEHLEEIDIPREPVRPGVPVEARFPRREGKEMEVEQPKAIDLTNIQARKRIRDALGRGFLVEEREELRELGETVSETVVEEIVEKFKKHTVTKVTRTTDSVTSERTETVEKKITRKTTRTLRKEKYIPKLEAKRIVRDRVSRPLEAQDKDWLNANLADLVSEEDVEGAVKRLLAPSPQPSPTRGEGGAVNRIAELV